LKRDPKALAATVVDLVVIGGGIYGAAIAREAALRGLGVALVERGDFGGATSANSHKIIHGGLRYLQHLDVVRLRESLHERSTLERIAPHLVHPLPVVVPTFGHGLRGKELLTIGVVLHRLFRLTTGDPPAGVVDGLAPGPISRARLLELLPGLADSAATGGVVFYDSQVYNSERLVLGYVRSAVDAGALAANYVEATGLLRESGRVGGVLARDRLDGATFEIRGRTVVNAAGPWIAKILGDAGASWTSGPLVRVMNVVTRQLFPRVAAGLYGRASHDDAAAVLSRGQRLYFFVPWRDRTIIGTANAAFDGDPSSLAVTRAEIDAFLSEVNAAYPTAALSAEDISVVYAGLQPSAGVSRRSGEIQVSNHYRIADHRSDGMPGFFSVEGVKYTTARDVAVKFVDRWLSSTGKSSRPSRSAELALPGGEVGRFSDYLRREAARHPELPAKSVERVVRNHGSRYDDVLRILDGSDDAAVMRAEALHAVRQEMAMTLADVVLRRTEIGSAAHPGRPVLEALASVVAGELGWTRERTAQEIAAVEARYGVP